jgi:hypothetical protein
VLCVFITFLYTSKAEPISIKLSSCTLETEPTSAEYFMNPSPQSVCLHAYPPAVARHRLGKNFIAATNTHATLESLMDSTFSMRSLLFQNKWAVSYSQKFLKVFATLLRVLKWGLLFKYRQVLTFTGHFPSNGCDSSGHSRTGPITHTCIQISFPLSLSFSNLWTVKLTSIIFKQLSSYLTESTPCLPYKEHPVSAIKEIFLFVLRTAKKTPKQFCNQNLEFHMLEPGAYN